jgi:hypothetical protein
MKKYLPYLIGGLIAYLLWQKLKALGNAAGNAVPQDVIDFFANPGGPVSVNAEIVLPNGSVIDANAIALDDTMHFRYNNRMYQLIERNANNQYVAVIS